MELILKPIKYDITVNNPITIPIKKISIVNFLSKKLSSFFLGAFFIKSLLGFITPKPKAGSESVIILIHNKWIASKGIPKSILVINDVKVIIKIVKTSPMLLDNKYLQQRFIFSYIPLPFFIAFIIVL